MNCKVAAGVQMKLLYLNHDKLACLYLPVIQLTSGCANRNTDTATYWFVKCIQLDFPKGFSRECAELILFCVLTYLLPLLDVPNPPPEHVILLVL